MGSGSAWRQERTMERSGIVVAGQCQCRVNVPTCGPLRAGWADDPSRLRQTNRADARVVPHQMSGQLTKPTEWLDLARLIGFVTAPRVRGGVCRGPEFRP